MEIQILGPLRIEHDATELTPTAPKLRQLTALLGLQVNYPVSVDQIIEELWQEHPPISALTTLQTYVYQLRKLLAVSKDDADGEAGDVSVLTRAGGYMLQADAQAMDWYRFEQLVQIGQREIADGAVAGGSATLQKALELWRGDALCDIVPGSVLRRELVRLEELRRLTMEQRIDAELRLGHHQKLVGELSVLFSRYPTHEGFAERLMIALNRSGRRTDALDIYQKLRGTLADELGLEPSSEVMQLQYELLSGAGGRPVEIPVQSEGAHDRLRAPIPYDELPMLVDPVDLSHEVELESARAALQARQPGVLVVGGPGSGKTTFALRAAETARESFPDGVFYLQMLNRRGGSAFRPSELPLELLRTIGVAGHDLPSEPDERHALFRRWTDSHRALLILDDVVHLDQVRSAITPGSGCSVLVVSRRRLYHPAMPTTVEIRALPEKSALRLLGRLIGDQRVEEDTEGARSLITLCQGSLLALRAAAARLQLRPHWRPAYLAERLTHRAHGLEELRVEGLDIENSIEASLTMLPDRYRRALDSLLAAEPALFTAAQVSTALKIDQHHADEFLEELVETQLLETDVATAGGTASRPPGGFRYRCPSLVRQVIVATGAAEQPPARAVAALPAHE